MNENQLQLVYRTQIAEATLRLIAASHYLHSYRKTKAIPDIESAALQVRKSLEKIAFAAIAPDKQQYEKFRSKAKKSPDFSKDFHANRIFTALERINPDFYPIAVDPPETRSNGSRNSHHFPEKTKSYLTKNKFKKVYDRLGKHLHADNPWGGNKRIENLASDLPSIIEDIQSLLDIHVRHIKTSKFTGVWVVETDRAGNLPRVVTGEAIKKSP